MAWHLLSDETLMAFSGTLVGSARQNGANRAQGAQPGCTHPMGPKAHQLVPLGCTATQSRGVGIQARPDGGSTVGGPFCRRSCAHAAPAAALAQGEDSGGWTTPEVGDR